MGKPTESRFNENNQVYALCSLTALLLFLMWYHLGFKSMLDPNVDYNVPKIIPGFDTHPWLRAGAEDRRMMRGTPLSNIEFNQYFVNGLIRLSGEIYIPPDTTVFRPEFTKSRHDGTPYLGLTESGTVGEVPGGIVLTGRYYTSVQDTFFEVVLGSSDPLTVAQYELMQSTPELYPIATGWICMGPSYLPEK